MINVRLSYNKGYKWFSENEIFVKGYIFTPDNCLLKEKSLINYFSDVHSFSNFQAKLRDANGLFSVLIKRGDTLWAAVDSTRSFPLFYYHQKDSFVITDNPEQLQIDHVPLVLEEDNAILFACSGFVSGGKTLLKDVFQLIAGESLCYENGILKKEFHTEFLTDTFFSQTRDELKEKLKCILEQVGKRMVKALDGRPVAIPLSGGFDSRLVAYLLWKNNYSDVFCYTFGRNNNIELKNAQRTAENLGYAFYFVNYEKYFNKSLVCDPVFKAYVDFATNYCTRFAEQDYYAIREFTDQGRISENTVFIPGHSGAIAGHLLGKQMEQEGFSFADSALDEVFSLVFPRKKDLQMIQKEINFLNHSSKYPAYLTYENWRFQGTTALASNFSKIWDFFGFEYLFPLWDKELFDFFVHVPFQHKYDKNLYKEVLIELFDSSNLHFPGEELFPSQNLVKKVAFRSKLKKQFPFLKYFINNIWKNDIIGSQYIAEGFIKELKESGNYRKMLSFNGISSAWYLMQVKKKLTMIL